MKLNTATFCFATFTLLCGCSTTPPQQIKQAQMEVEATEANSKNFNISAVSLQRAEEGNKIWQSLIRNTRMAQEKSNETWSNNFGSKLMGWLTGDTEEYYQKRAEEDQIRMKNLSKAYQLRVTDFNATQQADPIHADKYIRESK